MGVIKDLTERLDHLDVTGDTPRREPSVAASNPEAEEAVSCVTDVAAVESMSDEVLLNIDDLIDLRLLLDDIRFIDELTFGMSDTEVSVLLKEYRDRWIRAMDGESKPHARDNAGRFAANTWLRKTNESG